MNGSQNIILNHRDRDWRLRDFGFEVASGLMHIFHGDFRKLVYTEKQSTHAVKAVDWETHRMNDARASLRSVMQTVKFWILSDFLKVELRGDSVQTIDTKWDETIIAMQKHPDEELLENLRFGQLGKSDPVIQLVALYFQDTVQKSEPKRYTKLNRMVTRHSEQQIRNTQFSSRDRLGEKTNPVVPVVKGKRTEE